MASMTSQIVSELRDAAEHLPAGATLALHGLSWDDYEHVLNALSSRSSLRIAFDHGNLEIMSPSSAHERYIRFIEDLVRAVADQFDVVLEKLGQTTWKRRTLERGVEPDACYYVRNAERIIGKRSIDLELDPPPDIAVEIDLTSQSLDKFPIYAALSVPEVWRYDGVAFRFYELAAGTYTEIERSQILEGLTGALLAEAIAISKSEGQTKALNIFRERIRAR